MKKLYLMPLFFVISSLHVHADKEYCEYWDEVGWMGDNIYCYYWVDCVSSMYNVLKFVGSGDFYSKYRQMEKNEGSHPWDWTYVDGIGYEWNCKENARTIRFEGSIVSVPDVAFRLWPNITKVELTESVQCIGYRSFMDCDRLPEVTFYGNTVGPDAFKGCDALHTFTIDPKHGHVNIGKQAFSWAPNLRKIIIKSTDPNSVSLHPEAFYEAYGGITLCVPYDALEAYTNNPPANCNWWRIESIEYGRTLAEMNPDLCGPKATWNLSAAGVFTVSGEGPMFDFVPNLPSPWADSILRIKEVVIGHGITTVGQDAFKGADNLTKVNISESVKSIGVRAFFSCDNLINVTFGEGVENFDQLCFAYNYSLFSILLPSTTKSLKYRSFAFSSKLKQITCLASVVPEAHEGTFLEVDFEKAVLLVPHEFSSFYKEATGWGQFKNIENLYLSEELYSSVGYETPVGDTVRETLVYDTVRRDIYVPHEVNVYDTVHHQVLVYDTVVYEIHDKTVMSDTVYSTHKVQVNDYDTITVYVTDTVYTDTIYVQKYIEQDVTVYDTIVSYIFNWDNPDEVYKVIGKDEIIEIRRIDGSLFGYCAMNRMLKLSPGIYILRSFRTDNRLKIRVK